MEAKAKAGDNLLIVASEPVRVSQSDNSLEHRPPISAGFNALLVNLYLSRNNLSFSNAITDIEQVSAFLIGDIFGATIVLILLSYLLKPVLRQARNQ